jgi:nitroimidazol reductase NimA-like FMN-containing flavoprotein (pyridoxamine 5'-phosphate oxidase superfamily)
MKTIVHAEREQIEALIQETDICFVGMADTDGTPYVLPMNFGYQDGVVYLHSAQEGRKISILERNPKVCITFCSGGRLVYQHPDVACSYSMRSKSIVAWGTVVFETAFDKKVEALHVFMKHYSDKTFTFSAPAVHNVRIWKVFLEDATCKEKEFGISRKKGAGE